MLSVVDCRGDWVRLCLSAIVTVAIKQNHTDFGIGSKGERDSLFVCTCFDYCIQSTCQQCRVH